MGLQGFFLVWTAMWLLLFPVSLVGCNEMEMLSGLSGTGPPQTEWPQWWGCGLFSTKVATVLISKHTLSVNQHNSWAVEQRVFAGLEGKWTVVQ